MNYSYVTLGWRPPYNRGTIQGVPDRDVIQISTVPIKEHWPWFVADGFIKKHHTPHALSER